MKVEVSLTDKKITQSEADVMMSPLELDLIAYYKLLQEDVLKALETEKGDPEKVINKVLDLLNTEEEETITKSEVIMPVSKGVESEKDFVSRCVPIVMEEGKTQDQALGKCYGIYRNKTEKSKIINGLTDIVKNITNRIKD